MPALLPRSMIPYEVFGRACDGMVQRCPGCGNNFEVKMGIAYPTYFIFNGEPHYAFLPFCSTKCLLIWIPEEGSGHT